MDNYITFTFLKNKRNKPGIIGGMFEVQKYPAADDLLAATVSKAKIFINFFCKTSFVFP